MRIAMLTCAISLGLLMSAEPTLIHFGEKLSEADFAAELTEIGFDSVPTERHQVSGFHEALTIIAEQKLQPPLLLGPFANVCRQSNVEKLQVLLGTKIEKISVWHRGKVLLVCAASPTHPLLDQGISLESLRSLWANSEPTAGVPAFTLIIKDQSDEALTYLKRVLNLDGALRDGGFHEGVSLGGVATARATVPGAVTLRVIDVERLSRPEGLPDLKTVIAIIDPRDATVIQPFIRDAVGEFHLNPSYPFVLYRSYLLAR